MNFTSMFVDCIMRIFILLLFISFNAFSQDDYTYLQKDFERYKLYPTENINVFLKLDTRDGYVYQIQRRTGEVNSSSILISTYRPDQYRKNWPIDSESGFVIYSGRKQPIGRYKLYPTQNMWTFLMQDVFDGHTYMVQWGFEKEDRFIEIIKSEKFK